MMNNTENLSPVTRQVIKDLRGRKDLNKTCVEFLADDLKKRDRKGFEKFGKPLGKPNDPRDWFKELEEEILDGCQYAKAEINRQQKNNKRTVAIQYIYQQLLKLLVDTKSAREASRKGQYGM